MKYRKLKEKYNSFYIGDNEFAGKARLLQSIWRKERGIENFEKYGNYLPLNDAKIFGLNFLTPQIFELVKKEVENKEKVIQQPRIWNNMLSSQPLAFNLFGELSLNLNLTTKVFQSLFPHFDIYSVSGIEFEYSPGRKSKKYTNDSSAFDVFISYLNNQKEKGFLGIEVKYAESMNDKPAKDRNEYSALAKKSNIFNFEFEKQLKDKPIQQIWRDHLLALSMFIKNNDYASGEFIFLYPQGNNNCTNAIDKYKETFNKGTKNHFNPLTLENLTSTIKFFTKENWIDEFNDRYLNFNKLNFMNFNLSSLLRKNIQNLEPYSSARDEFKGEASVYLDANESPYNAPYNRYPDPLQLKLKSEISKIKHVDVENIFLGNGSDEAIDLVYRVFCEPKEDNVVALEPTYGMYKVCANINDVEYRKVLLDVDFQADTKKILDACDKRTKVIWICSPNNPTGNLIRQETILQLLVEFHGIVVVDEAYIDFAQQESFTYQLEKYPNLIVLQTFSKAWGSASIRLGMAFASKEIISVFNKIKYPYNVNLLTQEKGLEMLRNEKLVKNWVDTTLDERKKLIDQLSTLKMVKHIYPTDANFVLVKVDDANGTYKKLVEKGIIVRNRNSVSLCLGCLRITVGTKEENDTLMEELRRM